MKAVVYKSYGSAEVLKVQNVIKPEPQDNELLIKIIASTVNFADYRLRKPDPFIARLFNGPFKPKRITTPGVELSGIVEKIGKSVSAFKVGDEIFAASHRSGFGNAEYFCIPQDKVVGLKPNNLSFEQAATIPWGGLAALYFLKKGKIQPGQKVLIFGASGSVGVMGVQLAKYFGAKVTGLCSAANTELVKSLGADSVIDYTRDDFTKGGEQFDIIFDTIGKSNISDCIKALKSNGVCLLASSGLFAPIVRGLFTGSKKIIAGVADYNSQGLNFLRELAEEGKLKAVIDRTYSIEQIVEAHQYVEQGHKKGNVVVVL